MCVAALFALLPVPSFARKKDPDEKAEKQETKQRVEAITKRRYSRTAEEAFQAVVDLNAGADKDAAEPDRFDLWVRAGAWDKLRVGIAEFDAESAQKIYTKIINELHFGNPKPVMLPLDVLQLADAAPAELDAKQINGLGRLMFYAVQGNESRAELMTLLKRGTSRLGGNDDARRRAAALVLAGAELWVEAKEFGLQDRDLPQDAAVAPPAKKLDEQTWEQLLDALQQPNIEATARQETLDRLYQSLVQSAPQVAKAQLTALVKDRARVDLTAAVLGLIGQKTARASNEVDFTLRKVSLELQQLAVQQLAAVTALDQAPWQTLANLFAKNWLTEAQFSLKTFPAWQKASSENRDKYQHVAIEDLIQCAPADTWQAALLPQLSATIQATRARLVMTSDNIDRTIPFIQGFVRTDPKFAAELANTYLTLWAQRHNPNLTSDALKQFKLDSQAIVLTRQEQEASLKQLGTLLSSFDAATRKLIDEERLVFAFDICHSKAEIYTRDNIHGVFGSIEQLPASLTLTLLDRMRNKLAANWREMSVQRDAATRRTTSDVLQLVNDGYVQANRVASEWLAAHADDWRLNCLAGSVLSDWAEFAYFEAVVAENDTDRFAAYLQRSGDALKRFQAGAQAYAVGIPKRKRAEFDLLPYRAWFYGLLGMTHDADVNLRKGVTPEGLAEVRQAMLDLPGAAGEAHLELFSAMVADNVKKNRIAPQMKYRYLSSAVRITGRRPTVYPAEEKVQYYDSLLKEIRLQARLDGGDRIRPRTDFGVFVSLIHTADMARESGGFNKYLMNKIRRTVSGKTINEEPFYRDRFEEALRLALGEFFEIRAIAFADPNGEARVLEASTAPDGKPGWQETPLAYLHLAAKNGTVDRVPPLEIELDFFDRDGKVVIPVPSNPLLIEVADAAPAARPAAKLEVTQIIDARELSDRRLKMDVVATAQGLVPDLGQLIDLDQYVLPVTEIEPKSELLVRELHSGSDGLHAVSERSWTVHFDPTPLLRGADQRIDFEFPRLRSSDIQVVYRTYNDVDPVEAAAKVTLVEGQDVRQIAETNYLAWGVGSFAILAALLSVAWLLRKKPASTDARPPAFEMPRELTPFSVAALLHRILTSRDVPLAAQHQQQLRSDLANLERSAFAAQAATQSTQNLQSLAQRWLNIAMTSTA